MNENQEREAFEAWCSTQVGSTDSTKNQRSIIDAWRGWEARAALAAKAVPADHVSVPLQVLQAAVEAIGHFVSDEGWSDADMQAMDNLDAYIARHKANAANPAPAPEATPARYTNADLHKLAEDKGPFFADNARQALKWAANVLDAAHDALQAERARAERAEAAPAPEARCQCGLKPASECEPWEPGCDLGQSPEHVRVHEANAQPKQAAEPAEPAILTCEIRPRSLNYPLAEYHRAITDGPLHYTWQDKPHRIVYDLIAAVRYYAAPVAQAEPFTETQLDSMTDHLYCEGRPVPAKYRIALARIVERGHGIKEKP